jgi:hypothetical protein
MLLAVRRTILQVTARPFSTTKFYRYALNMAAPENPVDQETFKRKALLERGQFTELEKQILAILFELRRSDVTAKLTESQIKEKLPPLSIGPDSFRPAVAKLRQKLSAYNRKSTTKFTIPLRHYRLVIFQNESKQKVKPPKSDTVRLLLERATSQDPFEQIICGSSEDVVYLSIASQTTFDEQIQPWFKAKQIRAKHFRVLTWQPRKKILINALANLVGLDEQVTYSYIKNSWNKWKRLEKAYEAVEVYGYNLFPTIGGVCNDQQMRVELVPFNCIGRSYTIVRQEACDRAHQDRKS